MEKESKRNDRFIFFFVIIFILHLLIILSKLTLDKMILNSSSILKITTIIESDKTKKQMVESSESEFFKRVSTRFESDKNRFFFRQTKLRIINKFKKKKHLLTLSELGKIPLLDTKKMKPAHFSSSDYLPEIKPGDTTELNTVENKYFGFYQRIKGKLEGLWRKTLDQKITFIRGSGRELSSKDILRTTLLVTLNRLGEIIGIELIQSSGVKELDDAAIESFLQAGPFSNPPKGLLSNGKISLDWGFVVTHDLSF